ncbi:hypothetical protein DFH11DRAFT_1615228 [Phellopilus nigrolimitatus]|nr:hypothetical protein DFH11DRAFT_1615228 [Phellopilus nigrolimitatus]
MCRRNGSSAPRKRAERPLNIASRRGMTGWCKQSVERLPSRQTQNTVLHVQDHHRLEAIPERRRWSMRARIPSTSVRSLRAKCTEAVRSARELCGIDSASEEKSDGSTLETWCRLALSFLESVNVPSCGNPRHVRLQTVRLFEHRRLPIVLLDALVVRGAHNSQLVTYRAKS